MKYPHPPSNERECHHLFDTDDYSYYLVLMVDNRYHYLDRIGPYPQPNGWIFVDIDYSFDPEYLDHKEDYDRALEYFKKLSALL